MLYIVDSFKVHNGEESLTNKEDSCLKVVEAEDECCKGDSSSNTQNSIIKEKKVDGQHLFAFCRHFYRTQSMFLEESCRGFGQVELRQGLQVLQLSCDDHKCAHM